MSKNKTRKIVTKRFKISANGKIQRKAGNSSHLNRKGDSSTSNRKKALIVVNKTFSKKIKRMVNM